MDGRGAHAEIRDAGGASAALGRAAERAVLGRASMFFGYLLAMVLVMLVLGQTIAPPLFIAAYLLRRGGYRPRIALAYAGAGWLMMVALYDQIMHLFWYPSWLGEWLPELLPPWLPSWLFV